MSRTMATRIVISRMVRPGESVMGVSACGEESVIGNSGCFTYRAIIARELGSGMAPLKKQAIILKVGHYLANWKYFYSEDEHSW